MSHHRKSAAATETQGNLGQFLYRWSPEHEVRPICQYASIIMGIIGR